jgi:hypothetical protein
MVLMSAAIGWTRHGCSRQRPSSVTLSWTSVVVVGPPLVSIPCSRRTKVRHTLSAHPARGRADTEQHGLLSIFRFPISMLLSIFGGFQSSLSSDTRCLCSRAAHSGDVVGEPQGVLGVSAKGQSVVTDFYPILTDF